MSGLSLVVRARTIEIVIVLEPLNESVDLLRRGHFPSSSAPNPIALRPLEEGAISIVSHLTPCSHV